MKYREYDFLRNMRLFLSGRFALAFTILLIGVLTARLLTPENRGLYALFFTTCGLIVTLFHVGISPANVYFLNEKKREIGELFGNSLLFCIFSFLTLMVMFLFFVGIDYQGPFNNIDKWATWSMVLLVVLATLVETSISGLAYASNLYAFVSRALIIQSILLFTSVLAIKAFGDELVYVLFYRVVAVIVFIIYFVFEFKRIINIVEIKFSFPILKEQIVFGSKNWSQNIIGFLNVRSYILILGFTSSPKIVGFFSVAWLFIEVIRFLPETVGTMLLPSLTKTTSEIEKKLLTIKALKLILYFTICIALLLFFTFELSIPLIFGLEYEKSIDIAKILIMGSIFGCVYQVLTRHFTSLAQQRFSLIAASCGLVVGAIGCFVLANLYGGLGAAIAFCLSSLITAFVTLYFFCVTTNTSLIEILRIKRKDFSLI